MFSISFSLTLSMLTQSPKANMTIIWQFQVLLLRQVSKHTEDQFPHLATSMVKQLDMFLKTSLLNFIH
jgi:hypothetical protein